MVQFRWVAVAVEDGIKDSRSAGEHEVWAPVSGLDIESGISAGCKSTSEDDDAGSRSWSTGSGALAGAFVGSFAGAGVRAPVGGV